MEAHLFALDSWGEPVGAGASGARYCTLQGVAKINSQDARYTVANEFVCSRLAGLIGLPCPPGVMARSDDGELAYVSLKFGEKGESPPPVIPSEVAHDNPSAAAGVVAFDCWVLNGDRHKRNLAYVRGSIPLTVFDHSHSLYGPNEGVGRLDRYDGVPLVAGCLHGELTNEGELADWCDRISRVDARVIRDVFDQLAQVGALTPDEAERGTEYMVKRQGELYTLIRSDPQRFPNITQWSLTP